MERSEYFAKELLSTLRSSYNETYSLYLTAEERSELMETCTAIRFCFDWDFKFKDFYGAIASFHYPPLEFLWSINTLQIMSIENYILNIHSDTKTLNKFKESILRLCMQDVEGNDAHYFIQTGILSYFVMKGFPSTHSSILDPTVKKVCMETMELVLQGIFLTNEKDVTERFTCFFSLWNVGILERETLIDFCSYGISYYLNMLPCVEDCDVIETLERLWSDIAPYHLLTVVEKLLKTQKPNQVSKILMSAAQNNEINTASLLTALRAFLNTHKEAPAFLSTLARELMSDAYEKFSDTILKRSLLIWWQIVHQSNNPLHVNHRQWLQVLFKECSLSKDIQSYYLLLKVLSDFVPYYKHVECLKAAIDINISVPPEVQNVYADYITLLKTRVQDLKPQVKPEETVEKILSLFESLGKIPPVVLEISLLQKHKFLNEFLPALLIPRVVPVLPDVKEKFIQALEKTGKIPTNMLLKYRHDCGELQKLLHSKTGS